MGTELVSLVVYLGFAGVLGTLLRHRLISIAVIFGGLVFLPVSLGFSGSWPFRMLAWLLAFATAYLFNKCPSSLPAWLWGRTFAFACLGGLMFLVAGWGILSGYLGIGLVSLCAALLALFRLDGAQDHRGSDSRGSS